MVVYFLDRRGTPFTRRFVVYHHPAVHMWANAILRSLMISTRPRELSLKRRYRRTQGTMTSWSNCRPLNNSSAGIRSTIWVSIAAPRARVQFAPELAAESRRENRTGSQRTVKATGYTRQLFT